MRLEHDARLHRERVGHKVHRAPDRRRTVECASGSSLDLNVVRAGHQVGEIDPVDVVIFGIVLRHPVDHDRDTPLVEAAKVDIVVADAVAVLGVGGNGRKIGKEHRDILHRVAFADLSRGQIGERGRRLAFMGLRGRDDDRRQDIDGVFVGLLLLSNAPADVPRIRSTTAMALIVHPPETKNPATGRLPARERRKQESQ